jgi:hypothetical protein
VKKRHLIRNFNYEKKCIDRFDPDFYIVFIAFSGIETKECRPYWNKLLVIWDYSG